jgi:CPA2 family monovalent cation:H+ antiporter-2
LLACLQPPGQIGVPRLVIEVDTSRTKRLAEMGIPVLFGDAANSEILNHAGLDRAKALIVTVPDVAAALTIVTAARRRAPRLHIVSRASTWEGARHIKDAGSTAVVRPELEGGVEIVRQTLLGLDFPTYDVQRCTELVRREGLDVSPTGDDRTRVLEDLAQAVGNLEIGWIVVADTSEVAGHSLGTANVRARTGASVVAIGRSHHVTSNPGPTETLKPGDRVAVIGSPGEIAEARRLLAGRVPESQPVGS